MQRRTLIAATVLCMLLAPPPVRSSESCSMLGGICRGACGTNEQAEAGAFEDCGEKQECCVASSREQARCCVRSFGAAESGPRNCSEPVNGTCAGGSPSPVPCAKLPACSDRR